LPSASIKRSGFRNIVFVELERDALECLRKLKQDCSFEVGRAMLVVAEVKSTYEEIKEASIRIGCDSIGGGESFCFRLNKRGVHLLEQPTPELERNIGGAILNALKEREGKEPKVNLREPGVTICAEVLGEITLIGFLKKDWTKA
jgi:tRNA(Ser,Leu) C12 N-acetylase TAN1